MEKDISHPQQASYSAKDAPEDSAPVESAPDPDEDDLDDLDGKDTHGDTRSHD